MCRDLQMMAKMLELKTMKGSWVTPKTAGMESTCGQRWSEADVEEYRRTNPSKRIRLTSCIQPQFAWLSERRTVPIAGQQSNTSTGPPTGRSNCFMLYLCGRLTAKAMSLNSTTANVSSNGVAWTQKSRAQ